MKKKRLKKTASKAASACFLKGGLDIRKAKTFVILFKKFPATVSLLLLGEFVKDLKKEQEKYSLVIESATAIEPNLKRRVVQEIKKKRSFIFSETKFVINPQILGGLKIKTGDNIFDMSLENRISQLGATLRG